MAERAIQVCTAPTENSGLGSELGTRLAQAVPGRWTEVVGQGWVRYILEADTWDATTVELIARALADYILDARIATWMDRRLRRRYPQWLQKGGTEVRARAFIHLARDPIWPQRGRYVLARCRQALGWGSPLVVLDGIETFLLDRLRLAVEESVDAAVEDVEAEEEYREFLAFLQGFVAMPRDGPEMVHVVPLGGRGEAAPWVRLHDHGGRPVVVASLCAEDGRLEAEAVLGALLVVCPRRICVHLGTDNGSAQEWLEMVREVFGPRVVQCYGCSECRGQ